MATGLLAQAVNEVSRTAQIRNTAERLQGSTGNHKLSFNSYPSADCSLNGHGALGTGILKKPPFLWLYASFYHQKTLPIHHILLVNVSVSEDDDICYSNPK
ncbi:MAG: hypothetical protein V7K21_07195 [Nostoc sp.]|uniref:hypothetical protein n=1 Tax=Nostoc sp. TaxID=1180 RepID=UPI002FFA0CAD